MEFYDSNTGKLLFTAPVGRTMDEFLVESAAHGWPSFRDPEVRRLAHPVGTQGQQLANLYYHLLLVRSIGSMFVVFRTEKLFLSMVRIWGTTFLIEKVRDTVSTSFQLRVTRNDSQTKRDLVDAISRIKVYHGLTGRIGFCWLIILMC